MSFASDLNRLLNAAILYLFVLFVALPCALFVYPFILFPACFVLCIVPLLFLSFLRTLSDAVTRINCLFLLGLERAKSSSASSPPPVVCESLQATPPDDVVQC